MKNGSIGDYKVDYLKEKSSIIYSTMFDDLNMALDFAHKLPGRWIVNQRVGQSGSDYAWKMLPYGANSSYKTLVAVDHIRWVLIGIAVFAAIYILSKVFNKKSMGSVGSIATPAPPAPITIH